MSELTVADRIRAQPLQAAAPTRLQLARRALAIVSITIGSLVPLSVAAAVEAFRHGRAAGVRRVYRGLARLLERLGPTFVKFGQVLATRRDVLPPALCRELSVLHDAVAPMTERQIRSALLAAYGGGPNTRFYYDQLEPVASGSVASVFRAAWHDGRAVAVKLQRPGIRNRMAADLALMAAMVKLAERLPKCRNMPLGELTAYVATAILGQLDFVREANNLSRLGDALRGLPAVLVPQVIPEASRPNCIVMTFVPGLHASNVAAHSAETRRRMALATLMAAYRAIFVEGFVHCDLHPGNLYATRSGEVVILDAGYSVELSDRVRSLIAEFFTRLSRGDGRRCAEIVIESAVRIPADTDLEGFTAAVAALVERSAAPSAKRFEMMEFGNALFDVQRDYGLYAESEFAFPLMSLAIIESTVRTLSPDIDFRELGRLEPPPLAASGAGGLPGSLLAGVAASPTTRIATA